MDKETKRERIISACHSITTLYRHELDAAMHARGLNQLAISTGIDYNTALDHAEIVLATLLNIQLSPKELVTGFAENREKIESFADLLQNEWLAHKQHQDKLKSLPYIDHDGVVRSSDDAVLSPDWQGLIREEGKFWHVGPLINRHRSFNPLRATTIEAAEIEGTHVWALSAK